MPIRINLTKMTNSSDNSKQVNLYFSHLFKYQRIYLALLWLIVFSQPLLSNYFEEKPLLMGGESYYHLSSLGQTNNFNPLVFILNILPQKVHFLVPLIISAGMLCLFYFLAKRFNISEKQTFFIALFYVLTPTFIFSSVTLSSYSLFLVLVLLGTFLLLENHWRKYFCLFPFAAAALFDTFSFILLLLFIAAYLFLLKKEKSFFSAAVMIILLCILIVSVNFLSLPFFLGPFEVQKGIGNLVSDLGGLSGVGFFTLLLAAIGLLIDWKKKSTLVSISLLILFLVTYLFNSHTLFFLSLVIIVLAALGFAKLLDQPWKLSLLQNITLFLLLLGIAFSSVAYLERVSHYAPSKIDTEMLQWIRENTDDEAIILSAPENSYYIHQFAHRQPLFLLDQGYKQQYNLSQQIFTAFYIADLFPLLDKNHVSIIYISEDMKQTLPQDQGFLFLLQNERFKLLHFRGEAEVWSFEEEKQ